MALHGGAWKFCKSEINRIYWRPSVMAKNTAINRRTTPSKNNNNRCQAQLPQ